MLASTEEREVRIEVGYGLEFVITDLEAGNILDNIMIPNLKEWDFPTAFYESLLFVGDEIYKEHGLELGKENPAAAQEQLSSSGNSSWLFLLCFSFFGIFGLVIFLINLFRRRCPQCNQFFKLSINQEIIKGATYSSKGKKIS
ncbi:MAG: TPM domain-containing protein [Candidatus Humimicrobiaceae bacterium]